MAAKVSTLYEVAFKRTVELLKACNWGDCNNLPLDENPFRVITGPIIDALLTALIQSAKSDILTSAEIRPLLKSGRVTKFVLKYTFIQLFLTYMFELMKVSGSEFGEMLIDLTSSCSQLKIFIVNSHHFLNWSYDELVSAGQALSNTFSKAKNLKNIETSVSFNIESLRGNTRIEKLNLDFTIKNQKLTSFLSVDVNGHFRPQTSLKYLLLNTEELVHEDVALILKYCTELIYINVEITTSLELLHSTEFRTGTLVHKYKIQSCHLHLTGNPPKGLHKGKATNREVYPYGEREGIKIAVICLPEVTELTLCVEKDIRDYSFIYSFKSLISLNIKYNYHYGYERKDNLLPVLQITLIGHHLKALELFKVKKVDFASIGLHCPNLEKMKVVACSEYISHGFSENAFQKLRFLDATIERDCFSNPDTFIGLLSNALDIQFISFNNADCLIDSVMQEILQKNSLSKVKQFCLVRCRLTVNGLKTVVSSLKSLEYFGVYGGEGRLLKIHEINAILREINPRVTVYFHPL